MRKTLSLLCCLLLIFAVPAEAKKKKKNAAQPAPKEVRPPAREGLFNVQYWKDNYYFQVADSLLGRLFLVNTRYVSTPVNTGVYGGELANSQVLYWQKQGKQLLLRANMYDTQSDSTDVITQGYAHIPEFGDDGGGNAGAHVFLSS